MVKRPRIGLETVIKSLNRKEPFSFDESVRYDDKEKALIRSIQLRDKVNKDKAVDKYESYKIRGEKQIKVISSSVRSYIDSQYPKNGEIDRKVSDFEQKPKSKIVKENKKQVKSFLSDKSNKSKNETTYTRIEKASKKYPNASLYELRHGVNSKASQEYRLRHGLKRNYK